MNISSLIVKTSPKEFNRVKNQIEEIDGCEVYLVDKASSQLIVVLQAPSSSEEMSINKYIESIPGVMSANMHYTYQESEINAQLKAIDGGVSEFLNDDSIRAEDIAYSGSIAHLMGERHKKKV